MQMSNSTIPVSTLGTPRIGPRRELKFALEKHWSGTVSKTELQELALGLKAANWARQRSQGVSVIPSNDFSFYDQVLDTSVMVGAIPEIYGWSGGPVPLETYFTMARGSQGRSNGSAGAPAQEMTKWFDTNYHYMVPEFTPEQRFSLTSTKPVDEYRQARALGYETRPVLVGPVTFLKLGKTHTDDFVPIVLLNRLLPVYAEVLKQLQDAGAEWVQIDEPCLALDLDDAARTALRIAYAELASAVPGIRIMLASYFGALGGNADTALSLPVAGLHLDLVRAPEQLEEITAKARPDQVLSLGVIDGRNV